MSRVVRVGQVHYATSPKGMTDPASNAGEALSVKWHRFGRRFTPVFSHTFCSLPLLVSLTDESV